jgi:hypothetical protein
LVGRAPGPSLAAECAKGLGATAEPVEHMGGIAGLLVTAVLSSAQIEIALSNPVALWGRGAPVVVFEHMARAAGSGRAATVQDALVVDTQGASGAIGKDAALFSSARRGANMAAGHELGRAEFDGCVLRKIKDFYKMKLGAKDAIGIVVPPLCGLWALGAVMAGKHGQAYVGAKQRAHDAHQVFVEQHVAPKPLFYKDRARFVAAADAFEIRCAEAIWHIAGFGVDLAFEPVAGAAIGVFGHYTGQQDITLAAKLQDLRVVQRRRAVKSVCGSFVVLHAIFPYEEWVFIAVLYRQYEPSRKHLTACSKESSSTFFQRLYQ